MSTANVGLVRVEGLSLIRVGTALRDEIANWRYGARLQRRRRRVSTAYAVAVAGMASVFAAAALAAGHPTVVGWLGVAFVPYAMAMRQVPNWQRIGVLRTNGGRRRLRRWDLPRISLDASNPKDVAVIINVDGEPATLRGIKAVAFLSEILPRVNWDGGSEYEVRAATREVDAAETAVGPTLKRDEQQVWERVAYGPLREPFELARLSVERRLALEMAVSEEMERRALNSEAWTLSYIADRESEIAGIADNMFLPDAVSDAFGKVVRRYRR